MKTIAVTISFLIAIGFVQYSQAQSTTGGRSGGSTASTGTGYLTEGKRPAETSANSMTIADEGASRAYMYVPPTATKNQSKSPDGSGNAKANSSTPTPSSAPHRTTGKASTGKKNS